MPIVGVAVSPMKLQFVTTITPSVGPGISLEQGGSLLKEDGERILRESEHDPSLMSEDGFYFLKEDGGTIKLEDPIIVESSLLSEDASFVLNEDGGKINLEGE